MTNDNGDRDLLLHGELAGLTVMPTGSNYTFVGTATAHGRTIKVVYKPKRGESPLWDFPNGTLYQREYGAYLLSQILGWSFIPLTIVRDGPYGIGMVQRYVEHDPSVGYFQLREKHADALRRMAVFDVVSNNADRKAGHILLGEDGNIWGIDHGLTFNVDPKLRTVIFDFSGETVPPELLEPFKALEASLQAPDGQVRELLALLSTDEARMLAKRLRDLLAQPVFPMLHPRYNVPRPSW